jgi:hypothetical protein
MRGSFSRSYQILWPLRRAACLEFFFSRRTGDQIVPRKFTRYDQIAKRMTAAPCAHVSSFVFLVRCRETHMCSACSRYWLRALCCLVNFVYFVVDGLKSVTHETTRTRSKSSCFELFMRPLDLGFFQRHKDLTKDTKENLPGLPRLPRLSRLPRLPGLLRLSRRSRKSRQIAKVSSTSSIGIYPE